MWILACDGEVLNGKRLWLRPGKRYLFGRTKSDQGGFAIENKTISRKHLVLDVAPVPAGDGSKLHTKSKLTIQDINSKFGTQLDGVQIRGEARVLDRDQHRIKLGTYEHPLRVNWEPVVLCFSFTSKELKAGDPLEPVRSQLEPLDVKATIPYVIGKTSHVISTKRNTAKGLQALINAKYIVTESFVDAILLAAVPQGPDDSSSLESDFDRSWPDALRYLPGPGKEPNPRPSEFFAPDPQRANVFEGYTFIFCDNVQYDSLHSPIANGGGKALFFQLRPGKTTADDLVQYIKNVAGEKGLGKFGDLKGGKGVVVVRFRCKKDMEDWSIVLGNDVARSLDQRLIEQSEFLDAILLNDASLLRKSLPEEEDERSPPPAAQKEGRHHAQMESTQQLDSTFESQSAPQTNEISQPPRRTRSRIVTSRFKGFDGDFDPGSLPSSKKADEVSQMYSLPQISEVVDEEMEMSVDNTAQSRFGTQKIANRKRPTPMSEDEDQDEVLEKILPAAAAMKKRRIEVDEEARQYSRTSAEGPPATATTSKGTLLPEKPKSRNLKKQVDVLEVAREHREAEDEAARREQESLKASLDGMEIDEMKNLAVVEDMEIKPRSSRPSREHAYGDTGSRWDERWNGRKNFKKFRRRELGEGGQVRRGGTVIVGLEEVRKKDFGIGDGYWLDNTTKDEGKCRQIDPRGVDELGMEPVVTTMSQAPKQTQISKGTKEQKQPPAEKSSKTRPMQSGAVANVETEKSTKKRPPSLTGREETQQKKHKALAVPNSESEDSEDDLKFRFRRKK